MSSSVSVIVRGEALDIGTLGGQNEVGLSRLVGAALGGGRRAGGSGDKSRFRSPEERRESEGMRGSWENWGRDISEAVETRGTAIGKFLEKREWQFDAAISVLCGLDTTVITATSDGKSFTYQILTIMRPESIILCVTPLVALQEDQVRSCEVLGIKACALNAKSLEADGDLLNRASRGEYQAVFVTPEFIRAENGNFVKLLGLRRKTYTSFKLRCIAVIVDESHLVFHWRKFRKQYVTLGIIRSFFSGIPIMTLSATSLPHVRKRVNYTLGMARPTTLIERSVDRANIFLSVEYVRGTLTSYQDLNYLIPKKCESPADIPKTVVFVDNRRTVWSLTTYLLQIAEREFGSVGSGAAEFSHLVADYSTILSQEHRDAVLQDFADGYIRILICTEAAGMGVDIPDIQRVIQWGVPNFINLSTLWQRMGRAGRSRETQAVFTLWLQGPLRIKPASDSLALYRSPIKENDAATTAIISSIVDFEEKVDQLASRFGSNVLENFDEETLTVMDNIGSNMLTIPCVPQKTKDPRLRFDRGILALGSNSGCYRALFLRYFNSAPQPLISRNHCCANCAEVIPEAIKELLYPNTVDPEDTNLDHISPTNLEDPDDNPDEDLVDEDDFGEGPALRGPRKRTPYYIALAALPQLHAFRTKISMDHCGVKTCADSLLSFDEMRKICKSICSITQPQDFCRYLKTGEHYHLAPIAPHIPELLSLCQRITETTPKPPPRRRTQIAPPTSAEMTPLSRHRQPTMAPSTYQRQPSISLVDTPETVPGVILAPQNSLPIGEHITTMPPPKPPSTKPSSIRAYDPIKRREYYLKNKARKQEERLTLRNVTNETSTDLASTPTPGPATTLTPSTKRRPPLSEDQENIPPSKSARIR